MTASSSWRKSKETLIWGDPHLDVRIISATVGRDCFISMRQRRRKQYTEYRLNSGKPELRSEALSTRFKLPRRWDGRGDREGQPERELAATHYESDINWLALKFQRGSNKVAL